MNTELNEKRVVLISMDDDGAYGSALEHGDLFKNLKHIHISNH